MTWSWPSSRGPLVQHQCACPNRDLPEGCIEGSRGLLYDLQSHRARFIDPVLAGTCQQSLALVRTVMVARWTLNFPAHLLARTHDGFVSASPHRRTRLLSSNVHHVSALKPGRAIGRARRPRRVNKSREGSRRSRTPERAVKPARASRMEIATSRIWSPAALPAILWRQNDGCDETVGNRKVVRSECATGFAKPGRILMGASQKEYRHHTGYDSHITA